MRAMSLERLANMGGMIRTLAGALVLILSVSACGFQPVYTAQDTGAGTMAPSADLAAVNIVPIEDRRGQILHNHLLNNLNPMGRPRQPLYQLTTTLSVSVQSLGILADATASREQVRVRAKSQLSGAGAPQTFTASATSSYNTTESDYGSLVAQEDAVARALEAIANQLTVKLAAFFKKARAQS